MIKLRKFSSIEKYFYGSTTGFPGYDIYFFVVPAFIVGRKLGCKKQHSFSSEKYFLEREREKKESILKQVISNST